AGEAFWGGFHVALRYEDGSVEAWDVRRPEPASEELLRPAGAADALELAERLFELKSAPERDELRVDRCLGPHGPAAGPVLTVTSRSSCPRFTGIRCAPGWERAFLIERGRELTAVGGEPW